MNHTVNWEAIGAIGQIVGALAVVISLIYLAREIRTNARSARLASVGTLNLSLGRLATRPHLAELRSRGFHDYESLEGTDRARFHSYMHGLFRNMEDVYYLHLEGLPKRLMRNAA